MPGFGAAIGEALSKIGTKIPEMLGESKWGSTVNDVMGARDDYFRMGGAAGQKLQAMHMDFMKLRAQRETALDEPLKKLSDDIYNHPTLRTQVTTDSTLRDIHQKLGAVNHPSASIAARLAGPTGHNADKTLAEIGHYNISQARVEAGNAVYGSKMQNIIPTIMDAFDSKIPTQVKWAEGAMNLISLETHDLTTSKPPKVRGSSAPAGEAALVSGTREKIGRAFTRENLMRERYAKATGGKADFLPTINKNPTYTNVGDREHAVQGVLRVVQLPLVALKHIATVGNLSSMHADELVRGLLSMSDPAFKAHLEASSILAYTEHDALDKSINGRFGKVSNWTGSPTFGDYFYRSYHMPFFDAIRSWQLSLSASVGYHSAANWAAQAMQGDKRALSLLEEVGIKTADVVKQNGILTPDQKIQAMFHFTNNRFFMDKTVERSMFSTKNAIWRSATMYHTFVNAQQRFLRRELIRMLKTEDYVGIAQFAGTLGILFPAVAPILKSFEILGRTASPTQALASAETDYDTILHGSFRDRTLTYIDLLSHYGAFGIYFNYVSAARTNRFAYSVMGPTIGVGIRGLADIGQMLTVANKAGKHNAAPVVRDLLEDLVPIAGNIAAHKLAPTEKEQREGIPQRTPRVRRSRHESTNFWEY